MKPKGHTITAERPVRVDVGDVVLAGDLIVPDEAAGIVIFAHGSGSSRHSPRNRRVAGVLHQVGVGTLLMDLLTSDEEQVDLQTAELRFDIALLARRLGGAAQWLAHEPQSAGRPVGYFGASTGGAAALVAAANDPDRVAAVVSRGGRPDLAGDALPAVAAPTLLIVGGADEGVLNLNRQALERITAQKHLAVVAGATHLFEEPGALDQVAALAAEWFGLHLAGWLGRKRRGQSGSAGGGAADAWAAAGLGAEVVSAEPEPPSVGHRAAQPR